MTEQPKASMSLSIRDLSSPLSNWERELLHAREEIRRVEREKALHEIARLIGEYEITMAELGPLMDLKPLSR